MYEFRVFNKDTKYYYSALTALYPETSTQGFYAASFIGSLGDECTINFESLIFEQYIRMKDKEGTKIFEGDVILDQKNMDLGMDDPFIEKLSSILIVGSLDEFLYTYVYSFCKDYCIYHDSHEDNRTIFEVWKNSRSKNFLVIGNVHEGLYDKYQEYDKLYKRILKDD